MSPKLRIVVVLAICVVSLDQLSKLAVEWYVSPYDPVRVIPGFFSITHSRNPGAALGLFRDILPVGVFVALTCAALALIFSFYRSIRDDDRLSATALGLIFAGAVGNLIDRVWRGEVVDWVQFDLGLFIFPDFNVADSAIVIGVGLLLLDFFAFGETGEDAEAPEEASEEAG
ncbi:MAG: signal peptidase II [Deltaproteobacteria bacterium]|nr:signal peptidase II [Deltaproteobacteria bacterium]MBW2414612.1 signal peptidase II [Deltaproteobacteria bacterium]